MRRPRLLDLFCGGGGASMGYHRAGFDVVGVDIAPQPRYPFPFVQGDALALPVRLDAFDAVHASPPCQDHSTLVRMHDEHGTGWLLDATVELLCWSGLPWVVENVPGAEGDLGGAYVTLCGSSFGLGVRRHRHFASNVLLLGLPCDHRGQGRPVGVYGHGGAMAGARGYTGNLAESREAMGTEWLNRREVSQAIPPAYTEHLGRQLIDHLAHR